MNFPRRSLLLLGVALLTTGCAGLERHRDLIAADPASQTGPVSKGVRVTYLGTNGFLLESRDTTLLIDPFFSRIGLGAVIANARISPDPRTVERALAWLPRRIDAVLATHGHFDHLLDVPPIMRRRPESVLFASPTSVALVQRAGIAPPRTRAVLPGAVVRVGDVRIRVLAVEHDRVLGLWTPYPGPAEPEGGPPERVGHWRCGTPLAFLIEMGGRRIYLDSGGSTHPLPPPDAGPVDLAILGVALGGSRDRLGPVLERLRPRFVLPSHQDDFFRPLDRGFRFGKLTDFRGVRRAVGSAAPPAQLILLDYFQPWTLP